MCEKTGGIRGLAIAVVNEDRAKRGLDPLPMPGAAPKPAQQMPATGAAGSGITQSFGPSRLGGLLTRALGSRSLLGG